jgi:hypothetical protein
MYGFVRGWCVSCFSNVSKAVKHIPSLRCFMFTCTKCGKINYWYYNVSENTDKHDCGCIECL